MTKYKTNIVIGVLVMDNNKKTFHNNPANRIKLKNNKQI